jgi:predicted aspartyl protease
MQLRLKDNLPFLSVVIAYRGETREIQNVLIDTGSASSIFSADQVAEIQLIPAPEDILYTIRGVGGTEVVYAKRVDYLQVADQQVPNFQIEVGGMDYGFEIQGILGMDFLTQARAILDLDKLEMSFAEQ